MDEVKKLTIKDIRRMYEEKEPMSWISIYDYPMAYYADQAGIDVIFVGDSSTTTVLGYAKLPENLQTVLRECMDQIREENNEITREEDAYYIEKMKSEVPGLTVTEPDYESFAAVGRAVHEELVASVSGEELYDAIQALA